MTCYYGLNVFMDADESAFSSFALLRRIIEEDDKSNQIFRWQMEKQASVFKDSHLIIEKALRTTPR